LSFKWFNLFININENIKLLRFFQGNMNIDVWYEYEILCYYIFSITYVHFACRSKIFIFHFLFHLDEKNVASALSRQSARYSYPVSVLRGERKKDQKALCKCTLFFWLCELLLASCVCVCVCVVLCCGAGVSLWTVSSLRRCWLCFMTEEGCKSDCGSPHRGKGYQLPSAHTPHRERERERETGTDGFLDTCTWTCSCQTCLWHQ